MPVTIRLQRKGAKGNPFYFIVVTDSRNPRGGIYIQKVGTYDPKKIPAEITLDKESILDWLGKGAQVTQTVKRILSYKGVLFWKHLLRGVKLGLFDLETAEKKYQEWEVLHTKKIEKSKEASKTKKEQAKKKEAPIVEAVKEVEAPKVKEAKKEEAPVVEAPKEAEAPKVEEAKKEEAPVVEAPKVAETPKVEEAKPLEPIADASQSPSEEGATPTA